MPSQQMQTILDRIDRHTRIFDLDQNGLGEDLLTIASTGAHDCLVQGVDVDGNPLAELSDIYEAWKSRHYPGLPIGFRDLIMGQLSEFLGVPTITADEATVRYGRTPEACDELDWFCKGDPGNNRPARNVWGLTDASIEASWHLLTNHFHNSI